MAIKKSDSDRQIAAAYLVDRRFEAARDLLRSRAFPSPSVSDIIAVYDRILKAEQDEA